MTQEFKVGDRVIKVRGSECSDVEMGKETVLFFEKSDKTLYAKSTKVETRGGCSCLEDFDLVSEKLPASYVFKVGDKVTYDDDICYVVNADDQDSLIIERPGKKGWSRGGDGRIPKDYKAKAGDSYWWTSPVNLKLVKGFKEGDRVKLVSKIDTHPSHLNVNFWPIGATGTVIEGELGHGDEVYVRIDPRYAKEAIWENTKRNNTLLFSIRGDECFVKPQNLIHSDEPWVATIAEGMEWPENHDITAYPQFYYHHSGIRTWGIGLDSIGLDSIAEVSLAGPEDRPRTEGGLLTNEPKLKKIRMNKFIQLITKEPQKSFKKAGITNGDNLITENGMVIFSTWLLNKMADEFKKEVVDGLNKKEEGN